MKKKRAQKLIDECFEPMARAMGLWDPEKLVCYAYKKKGGTPSQMSAEVNPIYKWTVIRVWSKDINTRHEFLRSLRHELLHVTQTGFHGFFETASQIIPNQRKHDPPRAFQVLHTQWNRDLENDMVRLERTMDSLGMTGEEILRIGKELIP